jgi:hypothetical protein
MDARNHATHTDAEALAREADLEALGYARYLARKQSKADLADALRRAAEALRDAADAIDRGATE